MSDPRQAGISAFLRSRRARLKPQDVGLPAGRARRVPGLRREEVAALAGVGVTWYTLLERGEALGVSAATLDAVASALRLSESERAYVASLLAPEKESPAQFDARPLAEQFLLDGVIVPAYFCTRQWVVPAWNRAYALVWGCAPPGGAPWNLAERFFLDVTMRAIFGTAWPETARAMAGMIRAGYGKLSDDRDYDALVRRLLEDATFERLWETLDVTAPREVIHAEVVSPAVGRFAYSVLNLALPTLEQGVLVVHVPDAESGAALKRALAAT